jgi:uncharacterized protein YcbX
MSSPVSSHRVTKVNVTPVKGMRVQHPQEIALGPEGAEGDRDFFFGDGQGQLISVPRLGGLVQLTAAFDPTSNRLTVRHDDGPTCDGEIELGAPVSVRRSDGRQLEGHLVEGPWTAFAEEVADYQPLRLIKAAVPGAASDAAGVTLLGTGSLRALEREAEVTTIDARRFRMLIEFETDTEHLEDEWDGRVAEVGTAEIRIGGPVPRCAATTRDPDHGERDLPTVKVIKAYRGLKDTFFGPGAPFGVYADVVTPGRVRVGDTLRLR